MFYIFHGDDAHSQKETLARLVNKLGDPALLDLNTTRFTGVMPFAALRQACDALPFLAPARVVVISDLFAAKPSKEFRSALLSYLPQLPDTTRLIFLEIASAARKRQILTTGTRVQKWLRKSVCPAARW